MSIIIMLTNLTERGRVCYVVLCHLLLQCVTVLMETLVHRAGSGVGRLDLLRFLARCHTRQLNKVLCVLYLSTFFTVLLFIKAPTQQNLLLMLLT